MKRFLRTILAATALVLVPTLPMAAQPAAEVVCEDCLSAEVARADLAALYAMLRQEHVDLFARRKEAEYDAKFAALAARIDGPVARADFYRLVQEALALGGIGHAKSEAPLLDVTAHLQAGGAIIPLSVVYRDETMVTDEWASEQRQPTSRRPMARWKPSPCLHQGWR